MFDTRQYEWASLTLFLGGRDVTGIRYIKVGEAQEKEYLHAKGNDPHSIQRGNKTYPGEFGLLQSEYEALCVLGNGSILGLNLTAVASFGNPTQGDAIITKIIKGIEFQEANVEFTQGDKFCEVRLPFLALRLENSVL